MRRLARENVELLTAARERGRSARSSRRSKPGSPATRRSVVFLAAAKVGGIVANDKLPAEFLYDNLAIAANVIHAATSAGSTS